MICHADKWIFHSAWECHQEPECSNDTKHFCPKKLPAQDLGAGNPGRQEEACEAPEAATPHSASPSSLPGLWWVLSVGRKNTFLPALGGRGSGAGRGHKKSAGTWICSLLWFTPEQAVGRLCHSSKSSTVTCAEHGAGHCPKAPGSLHKRPESSDLCFGIRMLLHENARKEIQLPTQMRAQDGNAVHHKAVAQGPPLIKEWLQESVEGKPCSELWDTRMLCPHFTSTTTRDFLPSLVSKNKLHPQYHTY